MPNYLITGGTGTLGKAVTKLLLSKNVDSIRIYSRNEYNQVEMKREFTSDKLRFLIGDIRDRNRLSRAMSGVDYVIHCAALKHVDVCEYNPIEAVRTNIDGAINVIDCAIDNQVKKVINISSDKAVSPINLYGATKLVGEKLFISSNIYGKDRTFFSCIRFGNFWGSQGSVIPLWEKQKQSGKITITDENMTRYWISIDKGASFVIDCVDIMEGGEIFIPFMEVRNLKEIAHEIAPACDIEIIGKRQGEKTSESLWSEAEEPEKKEGYWVIRDDSHSGNRPEPLR